MADYGVSSMFSEGEYYEGLLKAATEYSRFHQNWEESSNVPVYEAHHKSPMAYLTTFQNQCPDGMLFKDKFKCFKDHSAPGGHLRLLLGLVKPKDWSEVTNAAKDAAAMSADQQG